MYSRQMKIRCSSLLAVLTMCLPAVVSGSAFVVSVTTTIPVQDVYPVFILCDGVPAASCNPQALFPLILTDNEGSWPAFPNGGHDVFQPVNLTPLWSGYITYIALAQGSSSNVVIGLRNGFVSTGSPWPFSTPESQIAADVLGGSQAQQTDLINFFLNNLNDFTTMGSQDSQMGTFWEFSNAVNVGSLSATAAPEPSSVVFMAAALGLCVGVARLFVTRFP
jgi:hypothetical protein